MDWLGQLGPYQGFASRTLAWWFLPNFATRTVITVYYNLLVYIGLAHWIPAVDSPKRPQHYRRAFALVVCSYLVYTLILDLLEQPPSFYSLLGVGTDASDTEIKNAYKAFARRNHPDRVGAAGAPLFIQVRDAYEALKHPIKRYGYDRFGFDALEWKVAENPHAMLYQGLESAMYYYVPTGMIMLALTIFGYGGHSAYWRSVTWALVATLETCLIIGYNPLASHSNPLSPILNLLSRLFSSFTPSIPLIPTMAPYQWVFFLRQLFVTSAIALGQVLPVLFPPPPTAKEEQAREAEIAKLAIALDPVVRQIIVHSHISDQEAKETLLKEMQYLDPTPSTTPTIHLNDTHRQALAELKPTMQRLFVQNVLLKDSNLRQSYISAVDRASSVPPRDKEVLTAGIGRDQLTPAPEEMDMTARLLAIPSPPSSLFSLSREPTPEYGASSHLGVGGSATPGRGQPSHRLMMPFEPSAPRYNHATDRAPSFDFDASTPGFNYQPSPARSTGPSPSRSGFASPAPHSSYANSSPHSGLANSSPSRPRRPSLSPSKRSSMSLSVTGGGRDGIPFSPTSPVMSGKQELA
ncbi:hypothetical protein FRC09_001935 [Ceratobasidium sp. 395]|nr:hypothetical protein FRC09_001935 [Ceratobasidium sp. 395]